MVGGGEAADMSLIEMTMTCKVHFTFCYYNKPVICYVIREPLKLNSGYKVLHFDFYCF